MNENLIESIAYCGLICNLCFQADKCDGCKTLNNNCERNLSDEGCYQKDCCVQKGYQGCWECDGIQNCNEGIYELGDMSKIKAFAICIQEDGKEVFMDYVTRNMNKGLSVEKGQAYDGKKIKEVLQLLREGIS